jgi:Flp pilus assembly protein TadG
MAHEWRVMKSIVQRPGLSQLVARFAQDKRGVSAVEFAMLLPLMITLYLGSVEVSQGIGIDRKVTLTTRTVADLASQVSSISNADMTNMLNASAAVIAPYDTSKLKVTYRRW